MKLKYSFEYVELGEEIIAIPAGNNASEIHGVIKINAQAREIMELLREETTEETVVDTLCRKYENDRDTLSAYVRKTVTTLRDAGILSE